MFNIRVGAQCSKRLHLFLRLRYTRVQFLRRARFSLFTWRRLLIVFRLGQTIDDELLAEAHNIADQPVDEQSGRRAP